MDLPQDTHWAGAHDGQDTGLNSVITGLWWTELCPTRFTVEALTFSVTDLEIKLLECNLVEWAHKSESLSDSTGNFMRRESSLSVYTHWAKVMGVHSKRATYKPGRKLSPKSDPADALKVDFLPPEVWENKFPVFNHSVYGISLWQHQ